MCKFWIYFLEFLYLKVELLSPSNFALVILLLIKYYFFIMLFLETEKNELFVIMSIRLVKLPVFNAVSVFWFYRIVYKY